MDSPENYRFSNTQLQQDILRDAEEINTYYRPREGEYARLKLRKMLGAMAAQYSNIPVFINGSPLIMPTPDGIGFAVGELTGKISGFSYVDLEGEVEAWKPSTDGVAMHVSVPAIEATDAPDAPWRLNVLPEDMRDQRTQGYIIGVPVTKKQNILQLGDKEFSLTPESLITPESTVKEYSYLVFVKKIQELTQNKPTFTQRADAARIQALNKLMHDMVFECPYLGSVVAIESAYLRTPKPNSSGFDVSRGQIGGVLRKFMYAEYQDYQTKQWHSDTMAVVYDPKIAALVTSGRLSAQDADKLPTTTYVPLSKPHVMATKDGIVY